MTSACDFPNDRRKTCHHAEQAAEKASDKAVKKTFAILGVDIDNPQQVEEFRVSLRFGDQLRKAFDRGRFTFVTAIAIALAAALWVGVKSKFGGP